FVERQLCGRALKTTIARWQRQLAKAAPEDRDHVECAPRAGRPTCTYGRRGEWDPANHFVFGNAPKGRLVLVAITVDDEVLVGDADVASEHAIQDKRISKLSVKPCR